MLIQLLIVILFGTQLIAADSVCQEPCQTKGPTGLSIFFSPRDKITDQLLSLIDNARKSIYAAVYMLTDKRIADALVRARQRGVKMALILDPISTGKYGKTDHLLSSNIPIHIYQPPTSSRPWFAPIMHNKFVCIDDTTVWTGSFNWTVSANLTNEENVIVSRDPGVCLIFKYYFDTLLKTKTIPLTTANQKKALQERTLRSLVTQALASSTSDDELYESLGLLLQQNGACWSSIQTVH
jgi:phosphatidylserine/phosphatidylglycerophosphate/cardiolipin synthase-like enzyme